MHTHFGTDMLERLGQEVCGAHPGSNRPIRMLHGLSTYLHQLRVAFEPVLHGLKQFLKLPARDTALFGRRTA